MTTTLWLLLAIASVGQPKVTMTFQTPSKVSEDFLAMPHGVAFDESGRLFVVDAKQSQVMVWDKNGTYSRSFGRKGAGPGELNFPTCITLSGDQVWVTDGSQRLHIFNQDGTYQKSIQNRFFTRVLVAVDGHTALAGARSLNPRENLNQMVFTLIDTKTGKSTALKSWSNDTFIGVGDGKYRWYAYGDDIDVQRGDDGHIYFGFSQDPAIYTLKGQKPQPEIQLKIPSAPPTDDERQRIINMSFPGHQGQRFSLGKSSNWIWDFSRSKAVYTHFLVKAGKALLVLTPLGSIQGIGGAYSSGSYFIVDQGSGAPSGRGSYSFPEDSLVFFEDSRILVFVIGKDGQYDIQGLSFEGF